jgi:HSP20 family protein
MEQVAIPVLLKDDEFNDELDFIFNTFYKSRRPVLMPIEKGWKPLTDVFETDDEVVIVMDIAGISVNDVKLTLLGNSLTIRGIRREHPVEEKRHYHKMEIDFGPFQRRIEIPARIDPYRAVRRYVQGFLEIRLQKIDLLNSAAYETEIDL